MKKLVVILVTLFLMGCDKEKETPFYNVVSNENDIFVIEINDELSSEEYDKICLAEVENSSNCYFKLKGESNSMYRVSVVDKIVLISGVVSETEHPDYKLEYKDKDDKGLITEGIVVYSSKSAQELKELCLERKKGYKNYTCNFYINNVEHQLATVKITGDEINYEQLQINLDDLIDYEVVNEDVGDKYEYFVVVSEDSTNDEMGKVCSKLDKKRNIAICYFYTDEDNFLKSRNSYIAKFKVIGGKAEEEE